MDPAVKWLETQFDITWHKAGIVNVLSDDVLQYIVPISDVIDHYDRIAHAMGIDPDAIDIGHLGYFISHKPG